MSIIKRNQIDSFKVDGETTINRYNYSTDTYDIVEGVFNGPHGIVLNKTSTKTYYIISGTGVFEIDDINYHVEEGDIIEVKPNQWLTIQGQNLNALIITSPKFNPADELWK